MNTWKDEGGSRGLVLWDPGLSQDLDPKWEVRYMEKSAWLIMSSKRDKSGEVGDEFSILNVKRVGGRAGIANAPSRVGKNGMGNLTLGGGWWGGVGVGWGIV